MRPRIANGEPRSGGHAAGTARNGGRNGARGLRFAARFLRRALAQSPPAIRVSALLAELATVDADVALERLGSARQGLSEEEAALRLDRHGPNVVAADQRRGRLRLFVRACLNPLVLLLAVLALVSLATGDARAAIVMSVMIVVGVGLRFTQEARADAAAEKLRAMIRVTATVLRDGVAREAPLADLVPGDVVQLSAGDMIPADVRVLACRDLFVTQAALTGESLPVEKFETTGTTGEETTLELKNLCFLGTAVESGTATAVVVETGPRTYLGTIASTLTGAPVPTAFDQGVARFTWLMIRFIAVMVPLVFVINGLTKHDWREAFFFAVAVAVGLTPEMLPMIVSVCLSRGALAMSGKKVIVKRLNSIQNLGAMDVLCTDKTGTLTQDHVILERHCDVAGDESDRVLQLAYLNSHFQTGLKNVLDRAVLDHHEVHHEVSIPDWRKVDELPFDFSRRLMSVVVETPDGAHQLVCKGAPEEIFKRCTRFEIDGEVHAVDDVLIEDLREEHEALSRDGFRVLALAYRTFEPRPTYTKDDESDLILAGYVAFLDPPKETASAAVEALGRHGVAVKILTGDNDLVSRKICEMVGMPTASVLLGSQIEHLSDADLGEAAERTTLFARMTPGHKQRVIEALQARRHVVGFLGDGINDSPALRVADVGISVDTAVDIAKEAADIILLEKSLLVVEDGVVEGRKVFSNILKYVRMGASSNFGNMFSVLGASAMLPFVPMAPIQILTNNLLYDFSQVPIPTDDVDPELVASPRPWSMSDITRFILFIGPCSSVFDYTTYFMMLYLFHCWDPSRASLFQTGWFVESLLTQTLIIHVIRTNKVPFLQSRASVPLLAMTGAIMLIGPWLPFSPLAPALGLTRLPRLYWPLLALTLLAYVALTQAVKAWLHQRRWI
ncbi:MAG TPA: magnesium-translocating P-type ATPase [Candidatus Binatia bacterium]|nr:magnesium-translocating P-type ATPase [Candidatus Binatia bacterium]